VALDGVGDVDFEVEVEDEGVLCGETGGENFGRSLWNGFLLKVGNRGCSKFGMVKLICVGVVVRCGEERSDEEAVGVSSPLCSESVDEEPHTLGEGGGLVL
jgi:hypothetical protein